MEQKPSVGRIVHYVSYGTPGGEYTQECRAAIITDLAQPDEDSSVVGLAVLNPTGVFFNRAAYDEWDGTNTVPGAEPQGGSWHWPERA
ncbi:MAG TPA: hypothetical protein VFO59_08200 [Dehalococcoidia bacterium]|nr:hypothetical protein [Dehalococcoidia bacterium]